MIDIRDRGSNNKIFWTYLILVWNNVYSIRFGSTHTHKLTYYINIRPLGGYAYLALLPSVLFHWGIATCIQSVCTSFPFLRYSADQ